MSYYKQWDQWSLPHFCNLIWWLYWKIRISLSFSGYEYGRPCLQKTQQYPIFLKNNQIIILGFCYSRNTMVIQWRIWVKYHWMDISSLSASISLTTSLLSLSVKSQPPSDLKSEQILNQLIINNDYEGNFVNFCC